MDYGNSELVQLSDLRSLEPAFVTSPVFTFHCRLDPGKQSIAASKLSSSPWIEGAASIAEEKTEDVDLFVDFFADEAEADASNRLYDVEVTVEGKSLSQMLLKPESRSGHRIGASEVTSSTPASPEVVKKPSFPLAQIPKGKVVVTMSHAEDVRNTFFHLFNDDVKLMSLASILDQIYMGKKYWLLGTICCAPKSSLSVPACSPLASYLSQWFSSGRQ